MQDKIVKKSLITKDLMLLKIEVIKMATMTKSNIRSDLPKY